jgi:hypothetical protein
MSATMRNWAQPAMSRPFGLDAAVEHNWAQLAKIEKKSYQKIYSTFLVLMFESNLSVVSKISQSKNNIKKSTQASVITVF